MQQSDQPSGSVTTTTGSSQELLVAALQHLYHAYQKTTIYPAGHPAVPAALDLAVCGLEGLLRHDGSLRIGVGRHSISVGNEKIDEPTGALSAFAELMHALDLAAIDLRHGIDRAQLRAFVLMLGEARRDEIRGRRLVEQLAEKQLAHLDAHARDYEALNFTEGSRVGDAIEGQDEQTWDSLGAALGGDSPEGAPIAPERLAQEVDQDLEEGSGIEMVRKRIGRLSREIDRAPPERRKAGRDWISRFVSSLSPRLRRDLLTVDPHLPGESLELLTELADVVPEGDLINALQQIDRAGARMSGQLGILIQKLMRLAHERPRLDPELRRSLERWTPASPRAEAHGPNMRETLRDVFQRHGEEQFNPQPYQRLLVGLSQDELSGEDIPCQQLYRDPRDADDVGLHTAQVAVRTLVHNGGLTHRAAIFGRVAEDTDLLLSRHKLDAVRAAAISARAHSESDSVDEVTKRAARTLLDGLSDERRMRLVTDDVRQRGKLTGAARALLARGGVTGLAAILDALDSKMDDALAHALEQHAAEQAPALLRRAMAWRLERGGASAASLLAVIRRLEHEAAVPLLAELMERGDSEGRGQALLALLAMDVDDAAERHLATALDDPDPRFVEVAVRGLAACDTATAAELLGSYIEGEHSRGAPFLDCGMLAARALACRGAAGRARLARALQKLGGSLRPAKVRLAVRVRDLLALHRAEDDVAAALRYWRRTPASLIGRLLPRRRLRTDEESR